MVDQPHADVLPLLCDASLKINIQSFSHLHFYSCTKVLMKCSDKLLSFIVLLGFFQLFIFLKQEKLKDFCIFLLFTSKFTAVKWRRSRYSLRMQPKSMQTVCAPVSVHVPRPTVYYIALCTHRVHYISFCACASTRAQCMCKSTHGCMCSNLCQCVWFLFLFFLFFLYFGLCAIWVLNSLSLASLIAMV